MSHESGRPTFHAETDVIDTCAAAHPGIAWKALDLYATAEPCPMWQGAVEFAGIQNVPYGTSRPWLQARG